MEQLLQTGEIVATHGIRGEVKILPWADGPEFLLEFETFYIGGTAYRVENARVQKTCVLAKLAGIDSVEQAAGLVHQTVWIDRGDVTLAEGVHYIADLIGMTVQDDTGPLGTVQEVLSLPGNDVYVVQGAHSYMIPVVREFVDEPDYDSRTIHVRLIEGMQTDAN